MDFVRSYFIKNQPLTSWSLLSCSSISEDLQEVCSICSQSCFSYCFCDKIVKYFCRFTQICKKFAAFPFKIVFVIVSEQFYYRNNSKNNFVSKCCKFLGNMCKSSEILEHCHVKWWLKYRINRSVSWRLSCTNPYSTA